MNLLKDPNDPRRTSRTKATAIVTVVAGVIVAGLALAGVEIPEGAEEAIGAALLALLGLAQLFQRDATP